MREGENIFITFYSFTIFILFVYSEEGVIRYSNIQADGKICPPSDLCQTRIPDLGWIYGNGVSMSRSEFHYSNCFCDNVCDIYGDCCIDGKKAPDQMIKPKYSCRQLMSKSFGSFTYNVCPANYNVSFIKRNCEKDTNTTQNPFNNLPIISLNSNIVYKNIYCCACNEGEKGSNSKFFIPILHCRTLFPPQSLTLLVTELFNRIYYNTKLGEWESLENGDTLVSEGCTMTFEFPPEAAFIRPCKPVIDKCAKDWPNDTTKENCPAYTAMLYKINEDGTLNTTYRNINCALCNHEDIDKLKCHYKPNNGEKDFLEPLLGTINYLFSHFNHPLFDIFANPILSTSLLFSDPILRESKSSPEIESIRTRLLHLSPRVKASDFSYAMLMDSDYSKGGNMVGTNQKCPTGQVYNGFKRKCQVVYCGGRYDTNC